MSIPSQARTSAALAAISLFAACAEDEAPADPTWADVAPILAAHCNRCHGAPAIGGAPATFRLDRYDDVVFPSSSSLGPRRVLGAAAMAEWIAERVGDGSMPPRIPLAQRDRELLANWFANRRPVDEGSSLLLPLRGESPTGNSSPVLTAETTPREDGVLFVYELSDPDGDLVTGDLFATGPDGAKRPLGELRGGRGEVLLDAALLPSGTHQLEAVLDDTHRRYTVDAGTALVPSLSPSPPRIALEAPLQGDYISTDELPLSFAVTVTDHDSPSVIALAEFVDEGRGVVQTLSQSVATNTRSELGFTERVLSPGRTYRVVLQVSDDTQPITVKSGRFRYEPATTSDTFQTISNDILGPYCLTCHATFPRVPTLGVDLSKYSGSPDRRGVYELRRRIYQRVFVSQDMPPGSARARGGVMTADQRDRLSRWLLAGAPQ